MSGSETDKVPSLDELIVHWAEQPHTFVGQATLDALERLSAAQGEIESLQKYILLDLTNQVAERDQRIRSLEADLASARLNERRYLWLIKRLMATEFTGSHYRYEFLLPSERRQTFDSAIDAAIEGSAKRARRQLARTRKAK